MSSEPLDSHSKPAFDETEAELLERWAIPDVTLESSSQRSNALNVQPHASVVDAETTEEEHEEPVAMTAELLEEIRQSAYEEGFEEGKKDGFEAGHAEGLEQGKAQGHTEGCEAGYQEALVKGQAEVEERTTSLEALMRALHEPQQQIDQDVEAQLVNLVTQLSESVVQHELVTNGRVILHTLRQAVELLPFQQQRVRVQLNPSDLSLIHDAYSDEQIKQRGWMLEAEPDLAIGDVRLLTEHSDVTIDMKERQQRVNELFLSQLNHHLKATSQPQTEVAPNTNSSDPSRSPSSKSGSQDETLAE
ncbi:flagellar assembly protein FliH [Echinimonas agarilytica]|uniref:Flagellar assembly protein FliH n=1 Tax=Echinimonas agarilytica TaxID=1215918 RepID=A0AA41W538_9GAMM|nr:flagellar assembly protein FliH [Echinimonas agarilytica]MCM2678966.1 flagellar assembly protein FliH [Echinimonas agarilytica]